MSTKPSEAALQFAAAIIEFREGASDAEATPGLARMLDAFAAAAVARVLARLGDDDVVDAAEAGLRSGGGLYDGWRAMADRACARVRELLGRP